MVYEYNIYTISNVLDYVAFNPENLIMILQEYQAKVLNCYPIYSRILNGEISMRPQNVEQFYSHFWEVFNQNWFVKHDIERLILRKVENVEIFNVKDVNNRWTVLKGNIFELDTMLTNLEPFNYESDYLNLRTNGNYIERIKTLSPTSELRHFRPGIIKIDDVRYIRIMQNLGRRFKSNEVIQTILDLSDVTATAGS